MSALFHIQTPETDAHYEWYQSLTVFNEKKEEGKQLFAKLWNGSISKSGFVLFFFSIIMHIVLNSSK